MAKHVEHILRIVLTPEFRDVIDEQGKPAVPDSDIYDETKEKIGYKIDPKYIYVMIQQNRYGLLDEIHRYHGVTPCPLSESTMNVSLDSSLNDREWRFNIKFSYEVWLQMSPEEVIYADKVKDTKRYETLRRKSWTDVVYDGFYEKTELPCALTFKRCKMTESGIYVTVTASCTECGCTFSGNIANKPAPLSEVCMECTVENFDTTVRHRKKRQVKGQRRVEYGRALVEGNQPACVWRRQKADKMMKFGDKEPPHLPNLATARKIKEQHKDKMLGIPPKIDPLESILRMKYDQHAGSIHGIGLDPFYVHYWTPEQMATYILFPDIIYVDGTGSLIKKIKKPNGELSPHIYLYQVVCQTPTAKMACFQALKAAQDTNALLFFFNEILRIGHLMMPNFPHPRQIVCDFDKALMGGLVRSYGECKNLRDYLSRCLLALNDVVGNTLPACFLRLDISHYVAMVKRWKILVSVHPRVKTFYIMFMCLLTRITNFIIFREMVRSAIILCSSLGCGKTSDNSVSLAEDARVLIIDKIKGIPDPSKSSENVATAQELLKGEQDDSGTEHEIVDGPRSADCPAIDCWAREFFNECKDDADKAPRGVDINPYYCPAMAKKIRYMLPYFPLYSAVMISKFGYGEIGASSSSVESEINDLKHRLLRNERRPMRADKFLTTHLRSFSGRAKLAIAGQPLGLLVEKNLLNIANKQNADNLSSVPNHRVDEVDHDDSEAVDNSGLSGESFAETQKPDQNTEERKIARVMNDSRVGENTNNQSMDDSSVERLDHDVAQTNAVTVPTSRRRKRISDSQDLTGPHCELTDEHNWRNKNETKNTKNQSIDDSSVERLDHDVAQTNAVTVPTSRRRKRISDSQDLTGSHCELTDEHNWRNKNETKKPKRCYLDSRPDWDSVGYDQKRVSIGLLQNGSICPMISEKGKKGEKNHKIVVSNTCGFDSAIQILAAATCRVDKFREYVRTAESETYSILKMFLDGGPSQQVYKMRASILGKVKHFVEEGTAPGVISINALSNICNIFDYVFKEDWSYIEESTCDECKTEKRCGRTFHPVDTNILKQHGLSKLSEAILNGRDVSKVQCCGQECTVRLSYGMQLFIECNFGWKKSVKVEDFPASFQLYEDEYVLAGLIMYKPGRGVRSIGHYTAWVKSGADWIEYDDLLKMRQSPPIDGHKKTPEVCVYVRS